VGGIDTVPATIATPKTRPVPARPCRAAGSARPCRSAGCAQPARAPKLAAPIAAAGSGDLLAQGVRVSESQVVRRLAWSVSVKTILVTSSRFVNPLS
jgi:hypothetical protein